MADDGNDGVRCDTGIGWIDRDFQRSDWAVQQQCR